MTVQRIDGGRARSSKEISLCVGDFPCPACSKRMRSRWVDENDQGAVARMYCKHCEREFDLAFAPGPGWAQRPDDSDPRYGATEDPSTIVPEAVFRRTYELALRGVRQTSAPPDSGDALELELWDAGLRAEAHQALGALLELDKLGGRSSESERIASYLRAVLDDPRGAWKVGAP